MHNIKRVSITIVCLLLILVVLAFVLENQGAVTLLFLGWTGPELPVSLLIVIALLIGMIIGPVTAWFFKRSSRELRKPLA